MSLYNHKIGDIFWKNGLFFQIVEFNDRSDKYPYIAKTFSNGEYGLDFSFSAQEVWIGKEMLAAKTGNSGDEG